MKKITLLLTFTLFTLAIQSQNKYSLVVFSEDNAKFTLFLNNIQQHEFSESNVWVGD
ncbi:MAG: hypothetical protein JKY22_08290 [Flavobacteriaceae bacterium]|nr:hypothetical protein [Flavobacteriaceae bacterium]